MDEINLNKPLVYIVIVNYGNYKLSLECVKSIESSTYDNLKIVIVDNDSPGQDYDLLKQYNDNNFILLKSNHNNGFSAGNNIGIKYSIEHQADYILLLNNDTFIDPNMVEILVANANAHTVCVPKIYYYNDKNIIWYAGGYIDYKHADAKHYDMNKEDSKNIKSKKCDFMSGCCALIPRSIFNTVGYLPEKYFMYFEDLDYSLMLLEHHINIWFCSEAKMWHKVGATAGTVSKMSIYYQTRNRLMISRKHEFNYLARLYVDIWARGLAFRGLVKHNQELVRFKAIQDFKNGIIGKVNF